MCIKTVTHFVLIFDGYLRLRESFSIQVIIWVNTFLKHFDAKVILTKFEGSCMVYRPECCREHKYCQITIPYWYHKCEILIQV